MRQGGLWHRLDLLARNLWPFALTVLLVIVTQVPLHIAAYSSIIPSLALIAVYYWTIHRPDLMPVWAVFLIGLFQDLLGAGPMGLGILTLLAVHVMVAAQRRSFASASFFVIWLNFVLVAAGAQLLLWLLASAYAGRLIESGAVIFQYLVTIAFYPCLGWIFAQGQRAFLRPE